MTLLEAIVATVILALVGVACLEGTQRAATLQTRAEMRMVSVTRAQSTLAEAAAGISVGAGSALVRDIPHDVRVGVRAYQPSWASGAGTSLQRVDVEVTDARGVVTHLTRLVESPRQPTRP
ncbi:MAG: hypothetical protein IBJ03_03545 [Gemmatimonadaceae bacterium]|nr:hypothetical protein [Gemmatimonadaceae bacterium]